LLRNYSENSIRWHYQLQKVKTSQNLFYFHGADFNNPFLFCPLAKKSTL
jgi:hypothetical protein